MNTGDGEMLQGKQLLQGSHSRQHLMIPGEQSKCHLQAAILGTTTHEKLPSPYPFSSLPSNLVSIWNIFSVKCSRPEVLNAFLKSSISHVFCIFLTCRLPRAVSLKNLGLLAKFIPAAISHLLLRDLLPQIFVEILCFDVCAITLPAIEISVEFTRTGPLDNMDLSPLMQQTGPAQITPHFFNWSTEKEAYICSGTEEQNNCGQTFC